MRHKRIITKRPRRYNVWPPSVTHWLRKYERVWLEAECRVLNERGGSMNFVPRDKNKERSWNPRPVMVKEHRGKLAIVEVE